MSDNLFRADPVVPVRQAAVRAASGEALDAEVASLLAANRRDLGDGMVLDAGQVARLVQTHALGSADELMLALLPLAQSMANPPISGFPVGAVALEAGSGALLFGVNVEFPGTGLAATLHGEGFAAIRAFNRGRHLDAIAIGEAHPCAHCRQMLSEFAAARTLRLIDPLGHRLTLAELYPWPFDPAYLGEAGVVDGHTSWPDLALPADPSVPEAARAALVRSGRAAHTPYSRCPSALVLGLNDGTCLAGRAMESVAFNPGATPLQSAITALIAGGHPFAAIAWAVLAEPAAGAVSHRAGTADLLAAVAPQARLTTLAWTGAGPA